eukprot:TRINITY_DN11_c0_g1_i1.p1 TRINITY_DN11_c0_g1~~TRINITY_DN11_c0_g1_i1.p1  ORF type:complete len:1237 (+),score=357.41 TRINITY_DN11_c0_g1_i1:131-3712(+)
MVSAEGTRAAAPPAAVPHSREGLLRQRVSALLRAYLGLTRQEGCAASCSCAAAHCLLGLQDAVGAAAVQSACSEWAAALQHSPRSAAQGSPRSAHTAADADAAAPGPTGTAVDAAVRAVRLSAALSRSRSSVHTAPGGQQYTLCHRTWSAAWLPPGRGSPPRPATASAPRDGAARVPSLSALAADPPRVCRATTLTAEVSDECAVSGRTGHSPKSPQEEQQGGLHTCPAPLFAAVAHRRASVDAAQQTDPIRARRMHSALPPDWEHAEDPATGDTYYWNRRTRQTTWARPHPAGLARGPTACRRSLESLESAESVSTGATETRRRRAWAGSDADTEASPSPVTGPLLSPRFSECSPVTSPELEAASCPDLPLDAAEQLAVDADADLGDPWPSCRFEAAERRAPSKGCRLHHVIDLLLLDDSNAAGPSSGLGPAVLPASPAPPRRCGAPGALSLGDVVRRRSGPEGEGCPLPEGAVAVISAQGAAASTFCCWVPGQPARSCRFAGCGQSTLERVEVTPAACDAFCAVVPTAVGPGAVAAHLARFAIALRKAERADRADPQRALEIWGRLLRLCAAWLRRVPEHAADEAVRRRLKALISLAPAPEGLPPEAAETRGELAQILAHGSAYQCMVGSGVWRRRMRPGKAPPVPYLGAGDAVPCAEQLALLDHTRLAELRVPFLMTRKMREELQQRDAERANDVSNWIASQILMADTPEGRTAAYRDLTETAYQTRLLGAYGAAQAIFGGVKHRQVQRIRELVGPDALRSQRPPPGLEPEFAELDELTSFSFRLYQDALIDAAAATPDAAAVPFIGDVLNKFQQHCETASMCKQRAKDRGETGGGVLLEWGMYKRAGALAVKLQVLQQRRYPFEVDDRLRRVLQALDGQIDLEVRSRELEALSPRKTAARIADADRPEVGDAVEVTTIERGVVQGTVTAHDPGRAVYSVSLPADGTAPGSPAMVLSSWPVAALRRVLSASINSAVQVHRTNTHTSATAPRGSPRSLPGSPRASAKKPWPAFGKARARSPSPQRPRSPVQSGVHGKWMLVYVKRAENLAAADITGASDPYVTVAHGPFSAPNLKTVTKPRVLFPRWGFDEGSILLPCDPSVPVQLTVWDWDRFTADDYLGGVSLLPTQGDFKEHLMPRVGNAQDAQMMKKNKQTLGKLIFSIQILDDAEVSNMPADRWAQLGNRVWQGGD